MLDQVNSQLKCYRFTDQIYKKLKQYFENITKPLSFVLHFRMAEATPKTEEGQGQVNASLQPRKDLGAYIELPTKVYNRRSYAKHLVTSQSDVFDKFAEAKMKLGDTERELADLQRELTIILKTRKS